VTCAVLVALGAQLAFSAGVVVHVAAPAIALLLSSGILLVVLGDRAFSERDRVRSLLGRFVPDRVVKGMLERPAGQPTSPESVVATMLFSDLRGFTSLAERLAPRQAIVILNAYLEAVTTRVLREGGTIVSYQGDGVLAVFGAPSPAHDHADRAVAAARGFIEHDLPRLNEELVREGLAPLAVAIGINSGLVLSGTIGPPQRLEYAAIGDATNVAARLQLLARDVGDTVLVGETTRQWLQAPANLLDRGEMTLDGRAVPVRVWALQAAPRVRPRGGLQVSVD
jgi:adenylate cyclase